MRLIQNLTQRPISFGIRPGERRTSGDGQDLPAIRLTLGPASKDSAVPLDPSRPHKVILAEWCAKASKQFGIDLKPDDVSEILEKSTAFIAARDGSSGFKLEGRTAAQDRAPQIAVG
jgi:hypothetical protein